MIAGAPAPETIDVGHEAWARRWTFGDDGQRIALGSSSLVHPEAASRARDDGALRVGSGVAIRAVLLSSAAPAGDAEARAALLAGGVRLVAVLRAADAASLVERAALLREARADLVVVMAGDGKAADGAVDLCEALAAGCALQRPAPRVLVAAAPRAAARVRAALAPFTIEELPLASAELAHAVVERARALRRGSDAGLVLRDEALGVLVLALARIAGAAAVAVDVTGDVTSLVRADPGGTAIAVHVAGIGVGRGADHVVARAGLDRVRRWIPSALDAPSLLERVFNRARWPDAVPAAEVALTLELALAHEAIAHALEDAAGAGLPARAYREAPLVVICGRPAALPRIAQPLLLALDALVPATLCSVLCDDADALVALGALAARGHGRDAAAAVAVEIEARHRAVALVAPLENVRGPLRIRSGAEERREPIARGDLRLIAARGEVELDAPGTALRGRGVAGPLGIVADARRPIELPEREAERVRVVRSWYETLGALPVTA